ncbi:MAG TPA: ATP-binding protein [Geopsychrobacteraceae bacterium]|nr:ATP-binding protein [Geopsychrobacteraceae bacterium]
MKITVKHQILLAPAAVLLLMTLLLGFMQYTYWDLSVKRHESKAIGTAFIALAEADLSVRRMAVLVQQFQKIDFDERQGLVLLESLYGRLSDAIERVEPFGDIDAEQLVALQQLVIEMNPSRGVDPDRILKVVDRFRAQLSKLSTMTQLQRQQLRDVHRQDIDHLVEQTARVSLIVLGLAILTGIVLSLFFARRILSRIQMLSDSAGRIAGGTLEPPAAPEYIRDELDALTLSINLMTKRLIQVVGSEKLLEGAEDERRRIAMDLHDQSLSDLSSILRKLQSLPPGLAGELEADLSAAISNLRDIMNNLHPQTLDILGLGAAIEAHLDRHCNKDGLADYHFYLDPRVENLELERVRKLALYRICLESINNVHKHSHASRYEVGLELRDHHLVISVEDNGDGFIPGLSPTGNGRGLNNIRERARAIGAEVRWVESRFSSGTRFELCLPVLSGAETEAR